MQPQQNWEEKLKNISYDIDDEDFNPRSEPVISFSDAKELISSLLQTQAQEIEEKVKGMKTYTGGSSVNEKDRRINKADTLLAIKQVTNK